jgi:hypothetical protein
VGRPRALPLALTRAERLAATSPPRILRSPFGLLRGSWVQGCRAVGQYSYPGKPLYPSKIHPEANCKHEAFLERPRALAWAMRTIITVASGALLFKWRRDGRVAINDPGRHAT